jgi:hypothetical protein
MPATNQQTSTISAKLIGPVAWRKVVLFIDSLIRVAVRCNWLIRSSARALSCRYVGERHRVPVWNAAARTRCKPRAAS